MHVSYRWLRALAPELTDSPERMIERLAGYGAPVEDVSDLSADLTDIVVAEVTGVAPHPNADRLRLCEVDAGGEPLSVVCGAPNVREGAFYPFAPVGGRLPDGTVLRKAKIRGEYSNGMLCSERELGLGRDHAGILELRGRFEPGEPFSHAVGLDDVRFEIEVTPNRPDLLSHLGVARELAPGGEAGLQLPGFVAHNGSEAAPLSDALRLVRAPERAEVAGVRVILEDADGCPRYMGAIVRDVRVGPSPGWLAARLRAAGLRPINNIVDATNYVLHELGQPLHAFDLARLSGPALVIRRARTGETVRTLDGEARKLDPEMVVIADAERPAAVAGVMGGEESEVTESTTDVFLECALFDRSRTRRTARALGLSTDASYRFERGVDADGMERALRRLVSLVLAVAGGRAETDAVDLYPAPHEAQLVRVRPARVSALLGRTFSVDEVAGYLEPLGFAITDRADDSLEVRVPGYRLVDVEREADLIEEVARRHGYDTFSDELRAFRPTSVPEDVLARLEDAIRTLLVGRGFLEARTAAFAPESEGDVALSNPLSATEGRLRRDLLPGLLHRVEHNFAQRTRDVRLFEIGTVFAAATAPGTQPQEATRLAVVLTGARSPRHWSEEGEPFDIWDLKGLCSDLAAALRLDADAIVPVERDDRVPFAPHRAFHIMDSDGERIGAAGQMAEPALDSPPWADPVFGLELELRTAMATPEPPTYRETPAFPAIDRDIALLVPDELAAAAVESVIRPSGGTLLESLSVFDHYRGRGVPPGTRSIGYRLRFRAPDRTLTDKEADSATARILRRLREELDVRHRA